MKIASSNVAMEGSSSKTTSFQATERLAVWHNGRQSAQPAQVASWEQNTKETAAEGYKVDFDTSKKQTEQQEKPTVDELIKAKPFRIGNNFSIPDVQGLKMRLLEMMYYLMTGRRVKLSDLNKLKDSLRNGNSGLNDSIAIFSAPGRSGSFGLEFDYHEVKIESEQVNFRANGVVQTEDGKTMSFDIDMVMSRFTYEESGFSLRIGEAANNVCDPLVINYGGGVPQLSKERHDFDLTMDGNNERISFAVNGSGFLALDKNGDNIINDGGELFGPQSGNGFLELSAYDLDQNNWIDENDAVFSQLRVLTLDESGNQILFTLAELGIGAIYLNNVETQYNMKDDMDTQGIMRSSSVFLKENGEAGTIHHIDLTI